MRRNVGLCLAASVVFALALAANAAAQGSVLQVTPSTASPGQQITVTGGNFSGAAGNSPVNIRLSTRSGLVLASPDVDSLGNINTTFPLPPSLAPGWYLLVATQTTDANGRQRAFTPGRTRILVQGTAKHAATATPAPGDGGPSPLSLTAGALALVLLAGAASPAVRRRLSRSPRLGS